MSAVADVEKLLAVLQTVPFFVAAIAAVRVGTWKIGALFLSLAFVRKIGDG